MIPLAMLAVASACWPIDASKDQIIAADLARALPEWRAVAADSVIGIAPVPGVIRIFHIVELRRLAARFGVASEPGADVCFQRPVAVVPQDRILREMQRRLPGARIDIIETSRMPAPLGELEFPLSGLQQGYWYGYISYGAGHKFAVWAQVDVKVSVKCVVASADLKAGQPIDPAQLQIEVREENPLPNVRDAGADAIEAMAGRIPRRTIRAGTIVQKEWLDPPRLVRRGDVVKVEAVSGAAKIEIEGVAETSGALGEIVSVQNTDSKRRFRAKVEARGRVSVTGIL